MTSDQYLKSVLGKYSVNTASAKAAANQVYPVIKNWSNGYLKSTEFSGSLAKGTAISIGTDADIFISLSSSTPDSLQNIYDSLYSAVLNAGYQARKQNVSVGTTINGHKIDLVPGRRQDQYGNEHSLYKKKTGSWTKTNIKAHINQVTSSNRLDEIKLTKIWRELHDINLPSFYLELAVIEALKHSKIGDLSNNFWKVLQYLSGAFTSARFIDPSNTNNVISDDLDVLEKHAVAAQAARSMGQSNWNRIVW